MRFATQCWVLQPPAGLRFSTWVEIFAVLKPRQLMVCLDRADYLPPFHGGDSIKKRKPDPHPPRGGLKLRDGAALGALQLTGDLVRLGARYEAQLPNGLTSLAEEADFTGM